MKKKILFSVGFLTLLMTCKSGFGQDSSASNRSARSIGNMLEGKIFKDSVLEKQFLSVSEGHLYIMSFKDHNVNIDQEGTLDSMKSNGNMLWFNMSNRDYAQLSRINDTVVIYLHIYHPAQKGHPGAGGGGQGRPEGWNSYRNTFSDLGCCLYHHPADCPKNVDEMKKLSKEKGCEF